MTNSATWYPAIVLVLSLAGGAAPSDASGATAAPISSLPVPGGTAALLRAAGVPGTPDPATAMLSLVRVAYGPGATPPEHLPRYLEVLTLLAAAVDALPHHGATVPDSGAAVSPPLLAWASACGLAIDGRTVKKVDGPEGEDRRRVLEESGVPLDDWIRRLNAGETVDVGIPAEPIPLPLPPEAWATVLGRHAPPGPLLRQIFGDRRAAFLYYGLMALDDETLTYLADHSSILGSIPEHEAGVFAEWGRSVHIRNGRVRVPGRDGADAVWQAIIGRPPTDVEGFIHALLARDTGRAAFFFDTVAHLDGPHQAFVLSDERTARDVYGAFARFRFLNLVGGWPRVRHPASPAAILKQVRVDEHGVLAVPSSRGFWDAAIGNNSQACGHAADDARPADAAFLVTRLEREPLEQRAAWIGAISFAQRVFPRAKPADLPAICTAVSSFPRHNGLILSLERIGLVEPGEYAGVLDLASHAFAGSDRRAAVVRTAQVQGVLVILERAATARVLPTSRLRELVATLAALAGGSGPASARPANAGLSPGTVGRWIGDTLLPALCSGRQLTAESCLIRASAGQGTPGGTRVVFWEDQQYRVDLGAATAVRVGRIRAQQKSVKVDDALTLFAAAGILADPRTPLDEVDRQTATLKALAPGLALEYGDLFGHDISDLSSVNGLAARLGGHPDERGRLDIAARLTDVADTALASALVSFAYALAIGDADDAILLAGDPARRHWFDATFGPATSAWHLPEEVHMLDRTWQNEGSVLGLYTVYARSWLRRLSIEDPGERLWPDPQDVRGFGETAESFNAFALTDESRDAVVAAIRRGRVRAAELVTTPDQLWQEAAEIGLSEWRCRAALWVGGRDPQRAVKQFSRSELLWLGDPTVPMALIDAWGVAARPIDGSLLVRMPRGHTWEDFQGPRGVGLLSGQMADVHLRVAEVLADLKLPAVLAPDVAAYAGWDVMTSAGMAEPDDWFALARAADALPEDRMLDYVSALTATGPLVPATDRQ